MKQLSMRWRLLVAAAFAVVGVGAVATALVVASGNPSSALAADATQIPGHPEMGNGWLAPRGGAFRGDLTITITAVNGNSLSLKTADGWTRTIDATGATVTKAGQTISVSALKVGDEIRFTESRQTDGTYKIVSITVVVPTIDGTVSAITSSSITVAQRDGSSKTIATTAATTYTQAGTTVARDKVAVGVRIEAQGSTDTSNNFTAITVVIAPSTVSGTVASKTGSTIVVTTSDGKSVTVDVTSSTKYFVRGVSNATLANVAVGSRIVAVGTLNSNGTLAATSVEAGANGQPGLGGAGGLPGFGGRDHGFGGGMWPGANPSAAPSAGASGSTGSNT
jgi:hypothetical protein